MGLKRSKDMNGLKRAGAFIGWLIAIACGALGLAVFYIVWAVAFVFVAVPVAVITWWWGKGESTKKVVALLFIAGVVAMIYFAGNPPATNPGSAIESRMPGVNYILVEPQSHHLLANTPPRVDQTVRALLEFRQRAFELRKGNSAVEQGLKLQRLARPLLDGAGSGEMDVRNIIDAMNEFDKGLQQAGLVSAETVAAKRADLTKFVEEWEKKSDKIQGAKGADELLADFDLQSKSKSLEMIERTASKLENSIAQLYRQLVEKEVGLTHTREMSIQYVETENPPTLVIKDATTIRIKDSALRRIDASELLLDPVAGAKSDSICVIFGSREGVECERIVDPGRIVVSPKDSVLTIVRKTSLPAKVEKIGWPYRFLEFSTIFVRVSPPQPARLRLVFDLTAHKGPREYPYPVDINSAPEIKSIRVPAYSYFGAGYDFTARRERDEHVLEAVKLLPDYFSRHRYIWIDLMPNSRLFRNEIVFDQRRFVFIDNLVIGLLVCVVGAFAGWLLAKSGS